MKSPSRCGELGAAAQVESPLPPSQLQAYGLDLDYAIPAAALAPGVRAFELRPDAATAAYLESAAANRAGRLRTLAQRALRDFVSGYDANAWLGMYPMFLLSSQQLSQLLGLRAEQRIARCLDVGAGSGDVTRALKPLCGELLTTERSSGMAKKLRKLGYQCLQVDLAETLGALAPQTFDLITCFNVLDRCPRPRSLLGAIVNLLAPNGRCLLSVPLPFDPMFYQGPRTPDPLEALGLTGVGWGVDAYDLTAHALPGLGLTPLTLSRVPYLSGGDSRRPLYALDAALVVARATAQPTPHVPTDPTDRPA